MNDSVQIVKPTLEDWEGFRDVVLRSLKDSPRAFLNTYEEAAGVTEDKWKNRIAGSLKGEMGVTLVAKNNGKIVGLVGVQFLQHVKMRHVAHIWGTYVDQEYRGMGIGRKLMEGIVAISQTHPGIKKIKIEVIAEQIGAYELFKKMGFQLIGVSHGDLFVDGNYYDEILMEMML